MADTGKVILSPIKNTARIFKRYIRIVGIKFLDFRDAAALGKPVNRYPNFPLLLNTAFRHPQKQYDFVIKESSAWVEGSDDLVSLC
jgi:hypothetical protein